MAAYLSPVGNEQQSDVNGAPLDGGKIFTYAAGTSTLIATYTDADGLTPQANPITLNASGLPANPIWLPTGQAVKLIIQNSALVTQRTLDDVTGINDPSLSNAVDQWVTFSGAPTYIGATSFSVVGDQTGTFQVLRRVKTTNTGGTVYSRISASAYDSGSGLTTVTVVNDAGTLDSGLSAVAYGLLSPTNPSIPETTVGKALRIAADAAAGRTALGVLASGNLIGVQIFTATGTYTPTAGTTSVVVEVQGAGGGSGGCVATTAGEWAAGRPGAGGGYGRERITSSFSGVTVTIGAGGTAGAAGNNSGGMGGTTSFGALISCTGGEGGGGSGAVQTAAGVVGGLIAAGGSATGADYGRPGSSPATPPFAPTVGTLVLPAGGDSYFGSGGRALSVQNNNQAGVAGAGFGAGASGPGNTNGIFAAAAGSAGSPGVVIVHEYA